MNLSKYAENLGKMNTTIYLLIDLKGKIQDKIVIVMKAKTFTLNLLRRRNIFEEDEKHKQTFQRFQMLYSIKNRFFEKLIQVSLVTKPSKSFKITRYAWKKWFCLL